jgi:hypothetical protein
VGGGQPLTPELIQRLNEILGQVSEELRPDGRVRLKPG